MQAKTLQIFTSCYCGPVMKQNTERTPKSQPKKYRVCNFRPSPKNEERIDAAMELNLNVSEIINEALEREFDSLLREKANKIQARLKMVRDTGFEPVTPTVSNEGSTLTRYRSPVQSGHRAPADKIEKTALVLSCSADGNGGIIQLNVSALQPAQKVSANGNGTQVLPTTATAAGIHFKKKCLAGHGALPEGKTKGQSQQRLFDFAEAIS